jgi:hypothetical protein
MSKKSLAWSKPTDYAREKGTSKVAYDVEATPFDKLVGSGLLLIERTTITVTHHAMTVGGRRYP